MSQTLTEFLWEIHWREKEGGEVGGRRETEKTIKRYGS